MANLSDWSETNVLDWLMGGATPTRPSARHVALYTAAPSDSGGGTEVSTGGYSRQALTCGAASGNSCSNSAAVAFTASGANWGDIVAISVMSASSGGNQLWWGFLGQQTQKPFALTDTTNDTLEVPAHGYSNGDRVVLFGSALPTGLSAATIYYVRDATTNNFKLAATSGGAAINATAAGSGTVAKINPKTVNDGDTLNFAIGDLTFALD